MDKLEEVWSLVYEEMKNDNNQSTFNLWFAQLTLESLTETVAVIKAKTLFKRNILRNSFQTKLDGYFEKIMGFKIKVVIISDEDDIKIETEKASQPEVKNQPESNNNILDVSDRELTFFSGNDDYTFENFIVGSSNALPYNACLAVANNPGQGENPLFIYGPSGLGKTHLLHAITNRILKNHPETNIVYVTGESFTNQLIESISSRKTEQFRNKYRNADILLIDDIQFIAGRENTQEEIFHTFNALYENSRQIILTADRPARDINPLEERLRTRFNWGLLADINPPDFELRAAIITSKAKSRGIVLSNDIVNMLAENLTSNIRELEGAVKKLCAIKLLSDKPITLEVARESISGLMRDKIPTNVTADSIIDAVSRKYGISREEIKSKKKSGSIVTARQISMYIMRKITDMSLPKIGNKFGRDHTTVISAINKIENEIKCNSLFEIEINELIKDIIES